MLKWKNVLLAFLIAVNLVSMPVSGEETPPQPETAEPAAAEEEGQEPQASESPSAEETPLPEESSQPASTAEPTPTPGNEATPEPEPTPEPDLEPQESEEPEAEIVIESEQIEPTGTDEVIDLGETLPHAAARLQKETAPFPTRKLKSPNRNLLGGDIYTDAAQLVSKGRVAQFSSVISPGQYEFISMFFLEDKVCYCVEPDVQVSLSNGMGGNYTGRTWENLDEEMRIKLKRISWFGYGFPATGTTKEAYIATQLLIWKYVAPDQFEQINSTLHVCPAPHFDYKACSGSRVMVDALMSLIENLCNNYDTVPSFADSYHRVNHQYLDWGQTLDLTDKKNVLSWFNDYSEEDHKGIHLRVEGNHMLVDIDDLYYDGWNTSFGKTLTFKRKTDQWENMLNGLLLYEYGDEQKLMATTGSDPTPQYQLSFKLRTGNLLVRKMDEYHQSGSFAAGTEFYAGWYEDPETQYQKTGSNDMHWTEFHDPDRITRNDEDGNSNEKDLTRMYYPIMTEDGTAIRRFKVDTDGALRINGFLPTNRKWWIREVGSANAFDLDDRPWSVNTGGSGETKIYSFVNKLRDITLELTKQDEEDAVTKLNDARFIFYETGGLDLNKSPTDYGTEINLHRMNTPALTFKQLKERSSLKAGDSFVFNGWLYTIKEVTENQYILDAIKTSEYKPADTNVFTRYQLPMKPAIGDQITAAEVRSMHGTFDGSDDSSVNRTATITGVRTENGSVIVTVSETEQKANILVNNETDPNYEAFTTAAAESGIALQRGNKITVGRVVYTIKSVNADSMMVSPDRDYEINLDDLTPEWSDIPDARNAKPGDTFTLSYPYSSDGETFEEREITFTVVQNGPHSMRLETGGETVDVLSPEWISYEDIPDTIAKEERFIVQAIQNPRYLVSDSRGNQYRITDRGTEVLHKASSETEDVSMDGASTDLTYKELIGGETIEGGACLEPFDVKGCPVGLTREKQLPRIISVAYNGPQYEDIEEENRTEGYEVTTDDTRYRIKTVDPVSLTISFSVNGVEYLAEVVEGNRTEKAFHTETQNVVFTIDERDEKEIDVDWKTIDVPHDSLASKSSLHLYAYGEEATQGDLNWDMVSQNLSEGATFDDPSGVAYTVLYADSINRIAVVESMRGRYEVTPDHVTKRMPVTWQGYVAKEEEAGSVFKVGDTVSMPYEQKLIAGDVFEKDGIHYVVQALDTADDGRGTNTLRNGTDYQKRVLYAWNNDVPLQADQLSDTDGTIMVDGKPARLITEPAEGYERLLLKDEDDNLLGVYILEELTDTASHDPYEETEPSFRVEVDKPSGLQYEEVDQARYGEKKPGVHVKINDVLYQIKEISEDQLVLATEDGEMITLPDEEAPFTRETVDRTPIELIPTDELEIKGSTYRILSVTNEAHKGTIITLKNCSTRVIETVVQYPDLNTYETETLTFYRTGNTYTLHLKPGEWGYRLRQENPHIKLQQEDNTWKLTSDANATAVLETLDAEQDPISSRKIIFSTTEPEGDKVGLPVFAGITGHQYIRIVDSDNHNMPIPGKPVVICRDEALQNPVLNGVSDMYGAIDVSALEPGVYWYQDPVKEHVNSVTVISPERVKGQLNVPGLKWGRTYLAYEETLPEGYDYGKAEVTHLFTMNADSHTSTIQAALENRLRRIALKVFKVDQDDHRIPLNNAWFTAEDVTDANTVKDEKQSSTYHQKITIGDIPNDVVAGDVISVWPTRTNGTRKIYRVEKVLKEEVILSVLENGQFRTQYHIPIKGFSITAPMQYTDITKALGTPKVGAVFEQMEKEPVSSVHRYQVTEVQTEIVPDVFGKPSNEKRVTSCSVFDLDDSRRTIITVKAVQSDETYGSQFLGEYVSGGILLRDTHLEANTPVTFEEALQAGITKPGDTLKASVSHAAPMPDYQTVQAGLSAGKVTLVFGGVIWNIRKGEEDTVILNAKEQEIVLRPDTIPGAISWKQEDVLTARSVITDGNAIKAITLADSSGSSWYLSDELQTEQRTVGTAGVHASAVHTSDGTIHDGYTGTDGRILFGDLPEGDYEISMKDVTSKVHVEKGMILLPEVKYGHSIEICETKSPLGYLIGNACAVIQPKAEYTVDTVTNTRTNAKLVTRRKELRKVVKVRKMGDAK
ncbi:MAG: thioester domain-containing protein [Solobacterium sp.]|nr:thioester domain-containing protein [Solobacterium sp.]